MKRPNSATIIDQVFVATDNAEIRSAAEAFGARVCMTAATHATGTDRVAEAAAALDTRIVINLQGDEPLISPEAIRQAVTPLLEDSSLVLGTLKTRIMDESDLGSPHVVKVVTDAKDYALYFSRAPIPFMNSADSRRGRVPPHRPVCFQEGFPAHLHPPCADSA